MGSLGRVLRLIFYILQNGLHRLVLVVFKPRYLSHNILEQVLHQKFRVSVRLQSLIHLNFDHFTDFVSDLHLLVFKSVYFVPNCITNLANFCSQANLLTSSRKFLLFDPPINASELRLEIILQLRDHLIFPLELCPYNCIHLVVAIS